MRSLIHPAALLACCLLTGCASYPSAYEYAPQPARLMLNTDPKSEGDEARVLVSISRIRREISPQDQRPAIDLKVRIENLGNAPLTFLPGQTALLNGELESFQGPLGEVEPVTIEPQHSVTRVLTFPFPQGQRPGQLSLQTLDARLTLRQGEKTLTRSLQFQREYNYVDRYYYYHPYPYYDPFFDYPYPGPYYRRWGYRPFYW